MPPTESLRRLARLHGVQTAYYDVDGEQQPATAEALQRVLEALGADIGDAGDATEAVTRRQKQLATRVLEPVIVAWDGAGQTTLRLPEDVGPDALSCQLLHHVDPIHGRADEQASTEWTVAVVDMPALRRRTVDGRAYVSRVLRLPADIPHGYHELRIEIAGQVHTALVMSAPEQTWQPDRTQRLWGVFTPLYAVHSDRSWGAGDLADLKELMHWTAEQGGHMVATLPLLPPQSANSDDPSPYSAGSRLFGNDLYLDLNACVAADGTPELRERVASDTFREELAALRGGRHVDYPAVNKLRAEVLTELSASFFKSGDRRGLDEFLASHPEAKAYATFQAYCETTGKTWFEWSGEPHDGTLTSAMLPTEQATVRRHLYAQWRLYEQLAEVGAEADRLRMTWYLDYPLGVSAAGYDVWKHRNLFVMGADGGAPPDAFFTKGQSWGFPPMHPEAMRQDHYAYLLGTIRHNLQSARLLRFDHVMGLYRLFFVPHGLDARDGAYVRYPVEELMALLCIESHRAQAQIVGEDLGTVPPAIHAAMERHGILGMHVLQFGLNPEGDPPVATPPAHKIASINTHDMPTFAAFRSAADVADRVDLGLMTPAEGEAEAAHRRATMEALTDHLRAAGHSASDEPSEDDLLAAALRQLGSSDSPVVLASLDDLWDEMEPQNTPGTFKERKNWSRRLGLSLEAMQQDDRVAERLKALAESRTERPQGF